MPASTARAICRTGKQLPDAATSGAKVQNSVYDLVPMGPKPKIDQEKNAAGNTLVNKADIAYCALMRKKRGGGKGDTNLQG